MPDAPTQVPTEQVAQQAQPDAKPFEAITSQEQLDTLLKDRLARERAKFADYGDLKAKAAKFDEAAEASKTELQKAQERAVAAEKAATVAATAQARLEVALEKGLTSRQAARLVGTTKDELLADADALLAEFPAAPKRPVVSSEGASVTPPAAIKEQAALAAAAGDAKAASRLKVEQLLEMRNNQRIP